MLIRNKILLIVNNFPPIIDGLGDYTNILMNYLKIENDIFVVCKKSKIIQEFIEQNDIKNVYPIINKWNLFSFFQIISFLKKRKVKNVILQYVPYSYNKFGIPITITFLPIFTRILGIKFYVFFHEVSVRFIGYGIKNFILGLIQRIIAYCLCVFSNNVFANNLFYKKLLLPFPSIYIPIPSNFNYNSNQYKFNSDKKLITIVSFSNRCDCILLEVISELSKNKFPKIKLVLIGNASESKYNEIARKIDLLDLSDVVIIYKNTDANLLSDFILNASVFVHLEKILKGNQGGVSTKSGIMMAAMNAGVPIVTTKGDMTDTSFFIDNNNCILLSNFNFNSLHSILTNLIIDEELASYIGINAKITYNNKASWEKHINTISLKIYS